MLRVAVPETHRKQGQTIKLEEGNTGYLPVLSNQVTVGKK